jgi:hypothetical protein
LNSGQRSRAMAPIGSTNIVTLRLNEHNSPIASLQGSDGRSTF